MVRKYTRHMAELLFTFVDGILSVFQAFKFLKAQVFYTEPFHLLPYLAPGGRLSGYTEENVTQGDCGCISPSEEDVEKLLAQDI